MKCPECKNRIKEVHVYSQCWQRGTLKGTKIVDHGSIEEILETTKIECPECCADLTALVEEASA